MTEKKYPETCEVWRRHGEEYTVIGVSRDNKAVVVQKTPWGRPKEDPMSYDMETFLSLYTRPGA